MIQRELETQQGDAAQWVGRDFEVFASRTAGHAVFGPRKYFFGFANRASL
jgi:hypothetical protein